MATQKLTTPETDSPQSIPDTKIPEARFRTCELLEALESEEEFDDTRWQDFLSMHEGIRS